MKKLLTIALLFVMVMTVAMTVVNAASKDSLANDIYAIGAKYGMNAGQKRQIEIILARRDLSDAECDQILGDVKSVAQIMDDNGLKSYDDAIKASAEIKDQIRAVANDAAKIADVTLVFAKGGVEVIDNETGEVVTTFTDPTKEAYTGSNTLAVIASVVAISLGLSFVAKRMIAANR